MSFDPKGTEPGALPQEPAPKQVAIRCKNERCTSMSATEVHQQQTDVAPSYRLYRCTKCGHAWSISVGGHAGF